MPIIVMKVLGFLRSSETAKKLMFYGFLLLIGFAGGNYHATQRALTQKADEAAAEEAKVTGDLFNAYKGRIIAEKAHAAEDKAKDQTADTHATVSIATATTSARADHDAAVAQIAREVNQEKAKEIINVSAPASCPLVEPFRFSSDTRRLLNADAGALPGPGPSIDRTVPADSVRGIAPATNTRAAATGR